NLATKILLFFETRKQNPLFCIVELAKSRKTCYLAHFFAKTFGGFAEKQYFCTVFFMVLDFKVK
ncbi:MAG: hypothetical protein ACI3Z8_07605, partial [Paludibacteraceae bacterium]